VAPLWNPEGARVDYSVGPRESEILELIDEISHRSATLKLEHERDVLEKEPAWP
jgi:hypothetical protein